jgi:Mn-dependent DtxR family transcriptional regulator
MGRELTTVHLQESGEMYLETIYILTRQGKRVRAVDVGEYMGFSKPSVSRAVGLLRSGGYLDLDANGCLVLTDEGRRVAGRTYERHLFLTDFFVSLGVDPEVAAQDACKIEHDLSKESFAKIKTYIEQHK